MGQSCSDGKIGHLVAFPDATPSDLPDPDRTGAWGGREIDKMEGFVLSRIVSQPSGYKEYDNFLYILTDHYGRQIIGITLIFHWFLFLVVNQSNEKKLLTNLLDRTFKCPLGRKGNLVSYAIFIEKDDVKSLSLFYFRNPDHSECDLDSYKLSVKFKSGQNLPAEAFRLLLEAFRLQHRDNEIYFGRISLTMFGLVEVGIMASNFVMRSFVNYVTPHASEVFFRGEMHPNGTGCSPGEDNHCTKPDGCGKFAG
jgi:hypothetical protein